MSLSPPRSRDGADRWGRAGWVSTSAAGRARLAAQHVLELGHERIAVITFALHPGQKRGRMGEREQAAATYAVTRRRLEGYRGAITAAGLDWSAVPVMAGVTSSVEEGAAAAAALLELGPAPTAILCLSNRLAEGAAQELRRRGLEVPGAGVGRRVRRRWFGRGAGADHGAPAAPG